MSKDEPAFAHGDHVNGGSPGLTKREYAAIQIRAGMEAPGIFGCADNSFDISPAEYAVREADALLAELEKTANTPIRESE